MAKIADITIEILKQIRDEITTTRTDLGARLDTLTGRVDTLTGKVETLTTRVDGTNERLDVVESTLLELAQQQRFVVRGLRTLGDRDHRLADDVAELRTRIDAIERRLP